MADNDQDETPSVLPLGLAAFTRAPATVTALVTRAADAAEFFKTFNNKLAAAEISVGTRAERKRFELDQLKGAVSEPELRAGREKALNAIRREVVEATDKARFAPLKAMQRVEEEVLAADTVFASPVSILAREGIGSPERSRYMEQITHSGPAELANLAALAVAERNKTLGAAILSRLDRLNKRDRELSRVSP